MRRALQTTAAGSCVGRILRGHRPKLKLQVRGRIRLQARSVYSQAENSAAPSSSSDDVASNAVGPDEVLLAELRFLECGDVKMRYEKFAAETEGEPVPWKDFKAAVDEAARPVDPRVRPIYASLTFGFVSQGIQFPVLPQLARSLGLGTADIGLVTAATACARLATNLPASWAAERLGRRPMLIAGPLMASVGMLGLASSSCFEHLILSNVGVGTGLATTMAGASLYLADVSTPKNRAQSTAPLLQSALLGFAIGPAIGGVLAQSLGMSLPFLACAGGLACSSAASAILLPETRDEVARRRKQHSPNSARDSQEPAQPPHPLSEGWRLLARPALQGVGFHVFMNGFTQGAFPMTLVLFAVEHMHMTSSAVGGMLTANVLVMVLTTAPATKLSDRMSSRKALMVPAMAAAAVFTGLQPYAADAYQFAALVGVTGFVQAISMPSISPLILDNTSLSERATALAGRQMMQDLGTLLGASSMGLVAAQYGIPAAMQTVALLQCTAVAWFILRVPGAPPAKGAPPPNPKLS